MNTSGEKTLLIRGLKDAGCGPRLIARCPALQEAGNSREQLRPLARQRAVPPEKLHAVQKKVDCRDYPVFNMKQENITKSGR